MELTVTNCGTKLKRKTQSKSPTCETKCDESEIRKPKAVSNPGKHQKNNHNPRRRESKA